MIGIESLGSVVTGETTTMPCMIVYSRLHDNRGSSTQSDRLRRTTCPEWFAIDSSGVYICKSVVNDIRHGNYICKSKEIYRQSPP